MNPTYFTLVFIAKLAGILKRKFLTPKYEAKVIIPAQELLKKDCSVPYMEVIIPLKNSFKTLKTFFLHSKNKKNYRKKERKCQTLFQYIISNFWLWGDPYKKLNSTR